MSQEKTPPLEISTLLFLREFFQGDQAVFPVSEPDLVSYGSPLESFEEQSLFLREYLLSASPETIARFSLPEGTSLREFDVALAPGHLPERLAKGSPVSIPCLLIPSGKKDTWVVILPLAHTFFVTGAEDLADAVCSETQRMSAVREDYSPWSFLRLFPAKRHELLPFTFPLKRERAEEIQKASNKQKVVLEKKRLKEAFEILASVGTALHLEEKPELPFMGRDPETNSLRALLTGDERLSVLLVGTELCGKSALFEAWLQEEKRKPKPRPAFSTSGAQLIAGMSGLGQWQARLRRVMEAAEVLDAVLFFDNTSDLLAERQSGSIDIPGAMKPYLEEGKVRLVGEITPDSLDLLESRQLGFFSCLTRLRLEPLETKKTKEIIQARVKHDKTQEPERPQLLVEAIDPLIDLAERYLPYRAFPGKAVRLYDELRLLGERYTDGSGKVTIDRHRVFTAFSLKTGIPEKLLREDHALSVDDVLSFFHTKLIGQDLAQRRVAEVVCVVKAGLQPAGKPLATFLFVGPTGVGKTELARTLALFLFGSEDRMLRFDMSEFMDEEAAERLIRGTERAEGLLTRKIRQEPFCVLLLDEIEKAHPAVFDLLLQVCGEGRLTDARGKTAYFHNSIIIMTSNLGAAQLRPASGFTQAAPNDEDFYQKQVNRSFRPEFVNRLDRIITFQSLNREEIRQVARLLSVKVSGRGGLSEKGVTLRITDAALDQIAISGYSEKYGARALRRHIEDNLVAPCAQILSRADSELRGAQFFVSLLHEANELRGEPLSIMEAGALRFVLGRPAALKSSREKRGFESISAARREVDRYMNIERVVQVNEQLDYLIAQMTYGDYQKNKDQRLVQDISSLQNEYHRLRSLWQKVTDLKAELEAIEEVGLIALFGNDEIESFVHEAKLAKASVSRELVYLLLCLEPKRDQITLLVQEMDDGGAFGHWLLPLLETADIRKWKVEVHYDGDIAGQGEQWPSQRRWGPPRPIESIVRHLKSEGAKHKAFLLRIEGAFAGVMLALECGLHRYLGHGSTPEAHMFCHCIALRTRLTDEEWLLEGIHPEAPPPAEELRPVIAVRELDLKEHSLMILKKMQLSIKNGEDYWDRFLDVLLAHLLLYEEDLARDRDDVFIGRLERRLIQLATKKPTK
jgi:ATP-dependent Clp protease ATP-binding subunit ClpC